jgi:biotin transport system substrate-specific component
MTASGARRAATQPATLADVLTDALAAPHVSPLIRDAVLVVAGAGLTALAAQVSFHAPWTSVPYTLQTGAVLLVGTTLGLRRGALSMAIYVLAGVIGLPVFSQGASGIAQLLGFTGGYLASFILAGALVGWLAERRWDRSAPGMFGLMVLGTLLIYAVGIPVLALVVGFDPWTAIYQGAIVFLPWDALKAAVAAGLIPLAWQLVGRR